MFPLQAEHGDVAIKVINNIVIRCHPRLYLFRGRVMGWKFNEINLIFNI